MELLRKDPLCGELRVEEYDLLAERLEPSPGTAALAYGIGDGVGANTGESCPGWDLDEDRVLYWDNGGGQPLVLGARRTCCPRTLFASQPRTAHRASLQLLCLPPTIEPLSNLSTQRTWLPIGIQSHFPHHFPLLGLATCVCELSTPTCLQPG